MFTDYHSHILPNIDDGSSSIDESLEMLKMLKNQGIERQIATPHFYLHKEKSVNCFIEKRHDSFIKINHQNFFKEIYLGAEVSLELGISECEGIEKLVIEGTNLILLEPSYYGFHGSIIDEIYNIGNEYNLKPIIAHIHRCVDLYSKEQIKSLLSIDAVFQINIDAFFNRKEKKLALEIIKSGKEYVFGSDAHNVSTRKPDFDILIKEFRKNNVIEFSNSIYDKYSGGII